MAKTNGSGRTVTFDFDPWRETSERLREGSTDGTLGLKVVQTGMKLVSQPVTSADANARFVADAVESVYDLMAMALEWLRWYGETPAIVQNKVRARVHARRALTSAEAVQVSKLVRDASELISDPTNKVSKLGPVYNRE